MVDVMINNYKERLDVLTQDAPVVSAIHASGEKLKWWPANYKWHRIWGKVNIGEAEPYCSLLYETVEAPQFLCTVETFEAKPVNYYSQQYSLPHKTLGWIQVSLFPCDMRLPTLQKVLNKTIDHRIIRYIPQKRCTLSGRQKAGEQEQFIKVFPDSRGRHIHEESLLIWQAVERGELDFGVAQPIKWEEETKSLWQGKVAGDPLTKKLKTEEGPSLAARIGKAAGSIPSSGLLPQQKYDEAVQFDRTHRYAHDLCARFPHFKSRVDNFLDALKTFHRKAEKKDLKPLHGSPHVKQWLYTDAQLGLVDFDRVSMGHPELDAATFVAEIDYENPEKYPVEELNREFLEGYQSIAGSLDMNLFQAYRAHKHFAKAQKAAQAVRLGAEKRAERSLERAMHCLKENTL